MDIEKSGGDLYSGEALKQDPHVKKLLLLARDQMVNGNLIQAKKYGRQAESLQPRCSTVLSFMGEVCRACGEEALAIDYFTRAMQLPKVNNQDPNEQTSDSPRHIWLAIILTLFVIASAVAMIIAVSSKKSEVNNRVNVIKTSNVITEPSWVWQEATVYNVEKDKTIIQNDQITMKGALEAYHSGNYQRAVVIYTKLLKTTIPDPYIYQYLAYSYQHLGDSQHAVQMLRACIKKCSMTNEKDMQSIEKSKAAIKQLLETKR
ncbi:MAG: hypothetical protein WCO98_05065 [bacterium]